MTSFKTYKATTNVHSDWVPVNGSILPSYNKKKTVSRTRTVSVTGTVKASYGPAEVSAETNVTVVNKWERTQSWRYSVHKIPKKKGMHWVRLMMYRKVVQYTVDESKVQCNTATWVGQKVYTYPYKSSDTYWNLQYRKN
ncbi:hypothetical protein ADL04_01375 [Streptomyces sp. NRRL B-3648]|nr:hypothetical protein ADL04_01375 [Streptomyces sp. NRRL B-3648]